MKRYKHWLAPARGSRYPDAIVCVEVATKVSVTDSGEPVRTEELLRWHTTSAVWNGEEYVKARHLSSSSEEDFWTRLARLTEKANNCWVFTSCAPRCWGTLGVFGRVETGQLCFAGLRDGRYRPGGNRKDKGNSSLIVLEDPTNAIALRFADHPGTMTWVDLRNYGVELSQDKLTPQARLGRSYRFVVSMIEALRLGQWGSLQITVSSQAMYTYRHSFMTHSLHVHDDKKALQLEHEAYVGGRCDAYQIGMIHGPIHHLDFSSLYASVSCNEHVPVQLRWYEEFGTPVESFSVRDDIPATADVLVETDIPLYPFPHNGIVVYPTGQFRTVLTGPELMHAMDVGHVQRIYRAAWYEMRPALTAYMTAFLAFREHLKREGLTDLETWCKRMLVGLPGKFGQRGGYWVDEDSEGFETPWSSESRTSRDGKRERWRTLAGFVQREVQQQWGPQAVPSVAAWITAAGRWRLATALQMAGWDDIVYCDTDSVMTNDAGLERLKRGGMIGNGAPGYLRLVESMQTCEIRGHKAYNAGERSANAGVPKGTLEKHGSVFYAWFTEWVTAALKGERVPDTRAKLVRVVSNRPYRHGVVMKDGGTRPFRLPQELNLIRSK